MSKELFDNISEKLSLLVVGEVLSQKQFGDLNQAVEELKSSIGVAEQAPVLIAVVVESSVEEVKPVNEAPVSDPVVSEPEAA